MAYIPEDMLKMLDAPGIPNQIMLAAEGLGNILNREDGPGEAYIVCNNWQQRSEMAIRSEIPDWKGLAGFRCITDFESSISVLEESIGPKTPKDGCPKIEEFFDKEKYIKHLEDYLKVIDTPEKFWCAYRVYFDEGINIHSGKLTLGGDIEKKLLSALNNLKPVLGGQAGNILYLWHFIGSDPIAYSPYFFKKFKEIPEKLPELKSLRLLHFENGSSKPLQLTDADLKPGVICKKSRSDCKVGCNGCNDEEKRAGSPSGGSIIVAQGGRRLIFQFKGIFDLEMKSGDPMAWDKVQFQYQGKPLHQEHLAPNKIHDITWPSLPLFCECHIDPSNTLIISLSNDETIENSLKGKVDFAVIGGIDSIFKDDWLKKDASLQARLVIIIENQLKTLAKCGIRIGVELSGVPVREYADFIRRMCREGVIVALGINGEDELPKVVGQECLNDKLYDFWLDPARSPANLSEKDHFEYITWLRAKKLADATGVRTLYVHNNTLDFILRKDADPGSLFRAQQGDMMGKGLVIAALMRRAYGENWANEKDMDKMTPAVTPEAMKRLGKFAVDFEEYEKISGSRNRILHSGYWIAPSQDQYSLAVVPVMWPHIKELPKKLNTTGAGDMTFGAFFLLSGV